jgi:hypothetical protein
MPNGIERAAYYRDCAAQVRAFAEGELNIPRRSTLLEIARQYEETAAELESGRVGQTA